MIDEASAREAADAYLKAHSKEMRQGDVPVIVEELTRESAHLWVFQWQSKRYVETGDQEFLLFGNGPIAVSKASGKIYQLGTGRSVEEEISQLERKIREAPDEWSGTPEES